MVLSKIFFYFSLKELLQHHFEAFVHIMNSDDILSEKAAQLVSVLIKNSKNKSEYTHHIKVMSCTYLCLVLYDIGRD